MVAIFQGSMCKWIILPCHLCRIHHFIPVVCSHQTCSITNTGTCGCQMHLTVSCLHAENTNHSIASSFFSHHFTNASFWLQWIPFQREPWLLLALCGGSQWPWPQTGSRWVYKQSVTLMPNRFKMSGGSQWVTLTPNRSNVRKQQFCWFFFWEKNKTKKTLWSRQNCGSRCPEHVMEYYQM